MRSQQADSKRHLSTIAMSKSVRGCCSDAFRLKKLTSLSVQIWLTCSSRNVEWTDGRTFINAIQTQADSSSCPPSGSTKPKRLLSCTQAVRAVGYVDYGDSTC